LINARYLRWPNQTDGIKGAVEQTIAVRHDHGDRFVEWQLSNLRAINTFDAADQKAYVAEIYAMALPFGGREYDGNIRFRCEDDIVKVLEALAPLFGRMNQVDYRAEREQAVRLVERDPVVKRIAKALAGGSRIISRHPTQMRHPGGKTAGVPEGKFDTMIEIGMVVASAAGKEIAYSLAAQSAAAEEQDTLSPKM
jgi:hypothetical protein